MNASKKINVTGDVLSLRSLEEYLELIGYASSQDWKAQYFSNGIVIDIDDKSFSYLFPYNCNDDSEYYDVKKDAEKIEELINSPNKCIRNAKKDFDKKCVEYPIEPKECFPKKVRDSKWVQDTTDVFGTGVKVNVEPGQKFYMERIVNTLSNEEYEPIENEKSKGIKYSENKLPIDIVLTKQFPNAIEAIIKCSLYGHRKYIKGDSDWMNFSRVKGGSQTYADAGARHNMKKYEKDEDSGYPHIYHKAWNAIAELELWIKENEKK